MVLKLLNDRPLVQDFDSPFTATTSSKFIEFDGGSFPTHISTAVGSRCSDHVSLSLKLELISIEG